MPIYVYQCQQCEAIEEHIQGFNDEPMTTCEKCGGELRKAVTSAAFHLKGGGWYKDGYASRGAADASDSSSDSAASGKNAASDSSGKGKDSGSSSSGSGSGSSSSGSDSSKSSSSTASSTASSTS